MGLLDKIKALVERKEGEAEYDEEEDEAVEETEEHEPVAGEFYAPSDLDQPPYAFVEAARAAARGDTAKVRDYLAFERRYARCRGWDDNTLLHQAALFARAEITALLLEHGAEPNLRYKHKVPLHYAAGTDALWLKANKKDEADRAAHKAQQAATVQALLKAGADPKLPDDKGETALHTAARLGHLEVVEILLAHGVQVDILTESKTPHLTGRTPLLLVAKHSKNPKVIDFLLEKGADPNLRDADPGHTPLHYIAAAPYYDDPAKEKVLAAAALSLLKHGARPTLRGGKSLHQPLHLAAANNHVPLAEVLLKKGADVNAKGDKSMTPMGIAAHQGSVDMVECLLRHGVDLYASRALFYAAYCRESDAVLRLLVEKGADINRPDETGVTPIFGAISANSLHNVKYLVERGADLKLHPPGRTLLQHAFANWGAIEALPEKEREKQAADARGIIEVLGGFKGIKL